jgi:hypothetical protein
MSSAEGPAPAAISGEPKPESGAKAPVPPEKARIALSQANRLANLASGAATTFLIGGVAAVVLGLFPLRLADRQWQLGVLANLVANGSWILIGLVLLHLASMLQSRNRALNQRLMLWRRLAALAAVGYLLIVPLQVAITWIGVDASRNTRERVISTSETQLKAYRDALMGAANLTDLKERLGAIPGAPPLPAQASLVPYAEVRERLLQQLEQAETRFRQQVQTLRPGPNTLELGRQTARGAIASLMLALGFASGAEGLFGQASLLESLKLLARKAKSKPAKGSRLKGLRNQFQWIRQRLNLPRRSAIRPISKPQDQSRRRPQQLKIPRPWQFWRERFWRKKKGSSSRRIRGSR